jgi:Flp pilus assembly protein TadD
MPKDATPKQKLLYLQALKLFKHLLGEEHPDVANCLNNLAFIYAQQGDQVKAETTYIQALEMPSEASWEMSILM